jgi:hypothetical protein
MVARAAGRRAGAKARIARDAIQRRRWAERQQTRVLIRELRRIVAMESD